MFALEKLNDLLRGLHKFKRSRKKHNAREARGIALQDGIISVGHGSRSISGPLGIEPGLRPRRHRRHVLFGSSAFGAAAALVEPDSSDVSFGSRRGSFLSFLLRAGSHG